MTTSAGGIKSKSFRRLRISLRHRWIAGESILNSFHFNRYRFVRSLSPRSLSRLDLRFSTRFNRSRDQTRDTFSQRPKFQSNQKTQICFVFFFPSSKMIKLYSFPPNENNNTTTRLSVSVSLSLSSSFPPTRARKLRFVQVRFSLSNVRDKKCLFPSSNRKDAKHYYLGCM